MKKSNAAKRICVDSVERGWYLLSQNCVGHNFTPTAEYLPAYGRELPRLVKVVGFVGSNPPTSTRSVMSQRKSALAIRWHIRA